MNGPLPNPMHELSVERVDSLDEADLAELCEATDAAIAEGGGFGWIMPQGREILERHFRGVMLVPERELFVARLDGHPVGSAQLMRPPRNNEAQAWAAQLSHAYIAPCPRPRPRAAADAAGGGTGGGAGPPGAEPRRACDAAYRHRALRGLRLYPVGNPPLSLIHI